MTRRNGDGPGQLLFLLVALLWTGGAPRVAAQASTNGGKVAVIVSQAATYQSSGQDQQAEQLLQETADLAQSSGDLHPFVFGKEKPCAAYPMTRQIHPGGSI